MQDSELSQIQTLMSVQNKSTDQMFLQSLDASDDGAEGGLNISRWNSADDWLIEENLREILRRDSADTDKDTLGSERS